MRFALRIALWLLVCWLAALPAVAAPGGGSTLATANEHVATANRAFQAGKYDKAIEELRIAYKLAPRAEFLLSFAQVYRAAGRLQEALEACHAYLAIVPSSSMSSRTRELVHTLEDEIAQSKPPPPAPKNEVAPPPAAPPEAVAASKSEAAPLVAAAPGNEVAPPPRSRKQLVLGLTLGAAGLVVVGLAVGLGIGLTRGPNPTLGSIFFAP